MKNYLGTIQIMLLLLLTGFISAAQHKKMLVTSIPNRVGEIYYEVTAEIGNAKFVCEEGYDKFEKYAKTAIIISYCSSNEFEQILQKALKQLYENLKTHAKDLARKLILPYPKEKLIYYIQFTFQTITKNFMGIRESGNSLLKVTDNPTPVYNCIHLNNFKAAEKAINKYIERNPNYLNIYNLKGDFYMEVKDRPNVYSSCMTTNKLSESLRYEKMMEDETASKKMKQFRILKVPGNWFKQNRFPNIKFSTNFQEINEECFATPAFSEGRIFIRGKEHLYCFGNQTNNHPN
ncbi:MAG: hypothetical protein JW761_08095 [Prolixibacteraceae bacterium]|nr:hypothetical protein [Prolixibacteraceae bacterium]